MNNKPKSFKNKLVVLLENELPRDIDNFEGAWVSVVADDGHWKVEVTILVNGEKWIFSTMTATVDIDEGILANIIRQVKEQFKIAKYESNT